MAETRDRASLNFYANGSSVGTITVFAPEGAHEDVLQVLQTEEAREYGEEPVQLLEGRAYEYEVRPAEWRLRSSPVVERSRAGGGSVDTGRIRPGSHTGMLPLVLETRSGERLAHAAVEVRSSKLSYRDDYRGMLEFITEKCGDLLMQIRAPAQARLLPDPGPDPQTKQQRFAFLRSVLESREFTEAIQRITAMPHGRLEEERYQRDIRKGFKPSSRSLREIAAGIPRMPVPADHPLAARMRDMGVRHPSLPVQVSASRYVETTDTRENQFVKHTLEVYADFLLKMGRALSQGNSQADLRLNREVSALRENLDAVLAQDFFRGISELDLLPLGSSVLQRRAGYREILQTWLKFNLAARLVWSGGEDVYGAGKRDVAALYEYWLFFQLLDLVTAKFRMERPPVQDLIEVAQNGFALKLKSGRRLVLHGELAAPRRLGVRFSYNRTFAFAPDRAARGSWTRGLRPDYTLSIWPAAFESEEAEEQELMVHLHFDAKYRAESVRDLFGSSDEDLQTERSEQRRGTYKRADLLKMHAYRDAIRRSEGAYVLYPGSENQNWRGFHEILPGLGAFSVRPGADGNAEGLEPLSEFLEEVVKHVSDRATRRERATYHVHAVQSYASDVGAVRLVAEKDARGRRAIPPAEHYVLVGSYEDAAHLDKIRRTCRYGFRVGGSETAWRLAPELAAVRHLLLYADDSQTAEGLWRVTQPGPRLLTLASPFASEFPGQLEQGVAYLLYEAESDDFYRTWEWDIAELLCQALGHPVPFAITLDKVLSAGITEA